ncbi:hypothetical protein MBLNU457_g0245t1 [Dothideomycetes sp. NU457]
MALTEQPWHAAFPAPKMTAEIMPRQRLQQMLSFKGLSSVLLIDVRRTDYEGGCIRESLNIPAQGFWWNRGMLYELAYKSDIQWVVFYCGSSNGRGPRCAAWFLEHVRAIGDDDMGVMVLEGGIKGWVKSGENFTRLMDGYSEEYWTKAFAEEEGKKDKVETRTGAGGDLKQ